MKTRKIFECVKNMTIDNYDKTALYTILERL